uniref:Smr domain-containing protein n=1 Tax=Arion vulgaris TaxID=1028688 RepID=A0A0B6ZTU4_9EUPU
MIHCEMRPGFVAKLAIDCQQQALRYQSEGMQGAALFYRQRAKKYKEDERRANSRAAQVLFEKGSERLRVENTLDLHFYHLDEAISAVNAAIEMKEDEYKKKPDKRNSYLDIVTGWGRNSRNGIPKLKPAISHHLWTKCFQYEERSAGMLRVYVGKKL